MVNPVPGYSVTTKYKATGSHWATCGWHTGQDYAAPAGTNIVAARGGTVAHVDYGSSFGNHQFAIRPGDGTEDFYAHTSTRPSNGSKVSAGQYVAEVGSEGNATGPHLHFERHKSYGWGCGIVDDPMKSHNAGGSTPPPSSGWMFPAGHKVYAKYLKWHGHEVNSDGVSDSIKAWQEILNHITLEGGETLPTTGQWFAMTADETQRHQTQFVPPPDSPLEAVFVGPKQFEVAKGQTGCPYVWVG